MEDWSGEVGDTGSTETTCGVRGSPQRVHSPLLEKRLPRNKNPARSDRAEINVTQERRRKGSTGDVQELTLHGAGGGQVGLQRRFGAMPQEEEEGSPGLKGRHSQGTVASAGERSGPFPDGPSHIRSVLAF